MRTNRAIRTTLTTAAVLALGVLAAPAASADDDRDDDRDNAGGLTTVVLNPDVVPVLVDDLKVAPVEPGALSAPGGLAQVAFPITEVESDEIEHSGGLRLTPVGGGTLRITEFEIELDEGVLSAEARLNGEGVGEVDVFDLVATESIAGQATCDGTPAGLALTDAAAAALGAPQFAGVFIGNACVVPN